MSLAAYKLLHVLGIVFLFAALGGSVLVHWVRLEEAARARARKIAGITHGVALLLVAFAGFGALAKLRLYVGETDLEAVALLPGWVWGKIVIWALLGAAPFVLRRKPALAGVFWWLLPLLGAAAAYLAFYKPA
jgi:hypothetical protein